MTSDKMPPYSEEAEKGLLGALLLDADKVWDVIARIKITSDSFYVQSHRTVFDAIHAKVASRRPVDMLTIGDYLRDNKEMDGLPNGILHELIDSCPTSLHAEYYATIVSSKKLLRDMIETAAEIQIEAYSEDVDSAELVRSKAEFKLAALKQDDVKDRKPEEVMAAKIGKWEKAQVQGFSGIRTGFTCLDKAWGGMQDAGLYLVSGPPKSCKTTLVRNIIENVARAGVHVLKFALEMTDEQEWGSMLASAAGQNYFALDNGSHRVDLLAVSEKVAEIAALPIVIRDRPHTLTQIWSESRRGAQKGAKLIVIDYVQRILADKRYDSDERKWADFSLSLIGLAKELRVPILAISRETDGKLYGARQWGYDCQSWIRLQESEARSDDNPLFEIHYELNRGPKFSKPAELRLDTHTGRLKETEYDMDKSRLA